MWGENSFGMSSSSSLEEEEEEDEEEEVTTPFLHTFGFTKTQIGILQSCIGGGARTVAAGVPRIINSASFL
jgi:hypothetical protein